MLTCVILNYNDASTVLSLYKKIKNYSIFDYIIIVDGNSTDNSFDRLITLQNEKTIILKSDKNGGYGYGNNVGIRYSKKIGADYALVANPDVEFSEKAISVCLDTIKQNKNCAACAPRINEREPAFRFTNSYKDTLSSSMIFSKLFRPRYYPTKYYFNKKLCDVYALPGSLVMFDIKKFEKCGFYDEEVFLYNEEVIIGKKFQEKGYTSILCLTESYEHYHSVTMKKNFKSNVKLKKIAMQGHKLFLKKYCHAGIFAIFILDYIIRPIAYIECAIWPIIKKKFLMN